MFSSLGKDKNGMTVHEKLDYIMENASSKDVYISLNVSCKGNGSQAIIASLHYADGTEITYTRQDYGDIQPSNFGTITKSDLVNIR